MKSLYISTMVVMLSLFSQTAFAAKESFDRTKPHKEELEQLQAACKKEPENCAKYRSELNAKVKARAQDYNSSRSNTTALKEDITDKTGQGQQTRAQDYNSSRSNTTTVKEDKSDKTDLDEKKKKLKDKKAKEKEKAMKRQDCVKSKNKDC